MKRFVALAMRLMGRRTCEDVVSVLCDYFEGTLDPKLAAIIERHLRDCRDCETFARTYGEVIKLTGELPADEIPDELCLRVSKALREHQAREENPRRGDLPSDS